jgi:hypothetical protein
LGFHSGVELKESEFQQKPEVRILTIELTYSWRLMPGRISLATFLYQRTAGAVDSGTGENFAKSKSQQPAESSG